MRERLQSKGAARDNRLEKEIIVGWFVGWLAKPQPQRRTGERHSRSSSLDGSRREMLALALRDTLGKHGIPRAWVGLEARPVATAGGQRGMHLRLVLREWDARFPAYMLALQKALGVALRRIDPMAPAWLAGISWCFDLLDDGACPTLPAPHTWAAAPMLLTAASRSAAPAPVDFAPTQPFGAST